MTDGLSHDGVIHFAVDSERTRIPLNATNMAGERVFFHACCNCGLIHEVAIGPDYVVFVRANEQDADLLRASVLAREPSCFPLRRPAAPERTEEPR